MNTETGRNSAAPADHHPYPRPRCRHGRWHKWARANAGRPHLGWPLSCWPGRACCVALRASPPSAIRQASRMTKNIYNNICGVCRLPGQTTVFAWHVAHAVSHAGCTLGTAPDLVGLGSKRLRPITSAHARLQPIPLAPSAASSKSVCLTLQPAPL